MAHRAGVVGGSGYIGAELVRLLAGHPEIDVVHVTADSNARSSVAALYPSLGPAVGGLVYERFSPAALHGLDVVFCALPHGESQREIPQLLGHVGIIVDLGADFRLPADHYATWYGEDHAAPSSLPQFAYGLPELFRDDLVPGINVAAPGCYPTTAALALAPLLAHGLVDPAGIVVDAMSGISGRGRGLSTQSLFVEANESVSAYGLVSHRHTGEIEHALGRVARDTVQVLFTPHLVPMSRGILATCHARPASDGLSTASLLDCYREHYRDEPFVVVVDEPPATKATLGANSCHVTVRYDPRTGSVLAIGALDNLVKGASGQAIQALNHLLDLPETTGLTAVGVVP
jgi:N-acetyl-gamma-glutamyl-phosphate reductase